MVIGSWIMPIDQNLVEREPDGRLVDGGIDASDPLSDEALREMLLRDIHHRFANSLQAISSTVGATLRSGSGMDAIEKIQDGISAQARIHRLLAYAADADVPLGPVCEALAANLLLAYGREDAVVHVRMDRFSGDPMIARGILLLVVELVTNALKHRRALEPQAIGISLDDVGDGFELVVANTGSNVASSTTARPRIAGSLAQCLGGTLAVRADRRFEVSVTLPRRRPLPASRPGADALFANGGQA